MTNLDTSRALFSGRAIGLVVSACTLCVFLALVSDSFLSSYTMFILSREISLFVLIAMAQAVCLVVGGMNLSVGAIGSVATVVLGLCIDPAFWGLSGWLAVPIALAAGAIMGLINGLLITKLRIDPFVVTLSMMFVYMGLRSGVSGGIPYAIPESFLFIGQGKIFGIPYIFIIMLCVLMATSYMFRNTVFGRYLLATGGNEDAARLSGINTDRMILSANILSGLFAALAAVLVASKLGTASPETGDAWLIISFAVAIIGGTGLAGGVISPVGVLMGAVIYRLIKHGLIELKANAYYENSFLGGLILLALVVDKLREIYSDKRKT